MPSPAITPKPVLRKQRARFEVRILGLRVEDRVSLKFRRCTRPIAEIERAEVRYAGGIIPFTYPTSVTYRPITLEQGATDNKGLFNWFRLALLQIGTTGVGPGAFKRDMLIREFIRGDNFGGQELADQWIIRGAYPIRYSPGEYDGNSDEFLIESLTVAYDYFEPGASPRERGFVGDISFIDSRTP